MTSAPRNEWSTLLPCQQTALDHVQDCAVGVTPSSRWVIGSILERTGLVQVAYDDAIVTVGTHARVALHFHPERLTRSGTSVAEGLLQHGVYRNQYETGQSSGSLSAFTGTGRDIWEHRLFGGAYQVADEMASSRPKYGALDVMRHPDGPSPRFGSCYFLLRPEVSQRSTFTFGGSQEPEAPERTGTLEALDPVMAPLLAQLEQERAGLGAHNLTVAGFLDQLTHGLATPLLNMETRQLGRALDSFIEAQVHGDISLSEDVDALVADRVFRDHPTGEVLTAISSRYDIPLSWHSGFTLPVSMVPDVFRDYPVRPLAERIAGQGTLNAANIGAAANSLELDPTSWEDWASHGDTLIQFRRLWHVVVLNGA